MLLADKTVNVRSNGIQNSNEFTIQQSAKMFNILSNSLYSDKVMAVIRELSTNAWDAHVAAGESRPFDVHLPTRTNPTFTVRDYGTGLSQEDMEHLYTTYGASNKNDSNDFVGCLGLGSKSPFAYTKSFTSSSYHNGKQYTYIAAMDETGVPTLNHISTVDTDEPNGMEISFAVKEYDCAEFCDKAKRIYNYFKTKPVVSGYLDNHDYVHHNIVISGDDWKVGKFSEKSYEYPSRYNNAGNIVAIMGSVAYPVDVDKVIGKEEKEETDAAIAAWNRSFKKVDMKNWVNFLNNIVSAGYYIEMRFDIGELEMDPARESLQYTKEVIATIRKKTQQVYLRLQQDLTEKIKSAPTKFEAYKSYNALSAMSNGWTTGAEWTDPDGKVYSIGAGEDLEYTFKSKGSSLYCVNWKRASYKSRKLFYLTDKIHWQTMGGYRQYRSSYDENDNPGNVVFFQCDTKSVESAYKIAIRYCNMNNAYAYLLVNQNDHTTIHSDFKELLKDVGEENVHKISDYRHLVQSKRKSKGGSGEAISNDSIFHVRGDFAGAGEHLSAHLNDAHLLKNVDIDQLDDLKEIVYVPITRYRSDTGVSISNIVFSDKDDNFGKKVFGKQNIFAIKTGSVKQFEKAGYTLVKYEDWFKKRFDKEYKRFRADYAHVKNLIEWADDQREDKSCNPKHTWSNKHNRREVFVTKFVELFGFGYKEYINSNELVAALDVSVLMSCLYTSCVWDARAAVATDRVLKKAGVKFNIFEIVEMKKEQFTVASFYQKNVGGDQTLGDEVKATKSYEFLPKTPSLVETFKKVLDKNPLLKYNVCAEGQGVARSATPLSEQSQMSPGQWGNGDSWFDNMDDAAWHQMRTMIGNTL